jgi:hypothetical protein
VSRFRRGMRGQPPPPTFKPVLTYRYDFARNMHVVLAGDKVQHEVTDEMLTLAKGAEEMAELFKKASAVLAEFFASFSKTFAHEMARGQAHAFVSKGAMKARQEAMREMQPQGGIGFQEIMDLMPPLEEYVP